MKKYFKLETGDIKLEDLLSSRTYSNPHGFQQCIYCDKEIESNEWTVFTINGQSQWVSPTRCNCEKATRELEYKLSLIEDLSELDSFVNEKELNKKIFNNIIKEQQSEFESFEEDFQMFE
jgi:hypothetical protein